MANAKTRDFEVFTTITANATGNVATIDLNDFVEVADMEAFGLEGVEIVIDSNETTPETAIYRAQLASENLANGFISHASYNSLYLNYTNVPLGFTQESLSLGDVSGVRYVPGGTLYIRADKETGANDIFLAVRLTGKIAKLSAKDYMALALTKASN